MSFVRIEFFYFLPIVFSGWLLLRRNYPASLGWLLVASLVFYGFNQWWLTLIIVSYCLVDWLTGLWLHRTARARLALAVGIGFNLLVLCFWKYTPLLVETTAVWLGWNAIPTRGSRRATGASRSASRSTPSPASPTWWTSTAARRRRDRTCALHALRRRSSRTSSPGRSCGPTSSSTMLRRGDADAAAEPGRGGCC